METDRPTEMLALQWVDVPVAGVPSISVEMGIVLGTHLLVGLPHIPRHAAVEDSADALVMAVLGEAAARTF